MREILFPYEFIGIKISSPEQEEKLPHYGEAVAAMKREALLRGQEFLFFPYDL
jgi:hypothetical protein